MSDYQPLISVIMTSDYAGGVVHEAIESVLRQTYAQFELVVVIQPDDALTQQVVERLALRDARIRSVMAVAGLHSVNQGCKVALGEFIAPISGEDIWPDQKLEWQVAALLATDSSIALGHVQRFSTDADGETYFGSTSRVPMLPTSYLDQILLLKTAQMINFSTAMIHRRLVHDIPLFDDRLKHAAPFDAWLRLASRVKFVHLDRELLFAREYPQQPVAPALIRERLREELRVINRHLPRGVAGWYLKYEAKRVRYQSAMTRLSDAGYARVALSLLHRAWWESSLFWRVSGWQTIWAVIRQLR